MEPPILQASGIPESCQQCQNRQENWMKGLCARLQLLDSLLEVFQQNDMQ